jgi:hypothetical protein
VNTVAGSTWLHDVMAISPIMFIRADGAGAAAGLHSAFPAAAAG